MILFLTSADGEAHSPVEQQIDEDVEGLPFKRGAARDRIGRRFNFGSPQHLLIS